MARAPAFPDPEGYRRRRLMDLARLLPLLGLCLFLLPVLDADDGLGAGLLIYLFAAWFGLIATAALLARRLCAASAPAPDPAKPGAEAGGQEGAE
ncbi:hypothetical protein [Rhodovulum adriaticum]|uniref:Uncharacterized protein n=1 Tax=Rhodovulum adriaticum TaxID=35804 RepID=A0A4R2NJ20_RHOAD|nr:hypothetical protein [Rhodovulum adriaticum]MBK1636549.1 hypothetical protein [Rhodovulum adriaticum]TCP21215.1 hypothetical protein EV656_11231 [Rhodovulum adriaticum]